MDLNNIIFHELVTEQHDTDVRVIPRESEIPLPNLNADGLVSEARQSYNKDTGISYAEYGHDWFPDHLLKLVDGEIDFYSFSLKGLKELEGRLRREPLSTGGYLFFIRYKEDGTDFLMVLLLKDISGFVVDDSTISESHILNLDKLHFGARINISKWQSQDGTYISFLRGSSRQDITRYFRDFLCINDQTFNDPGKNTLALVAAVKDYCQEYCSSDQEIFEVKSRVQTELERRVADKRTITIEAISALVDPDEAEKFSTFLNVSEYEVQDEFRPDKNKLKKLSRFSGRTADLSINFESDALEDGSIKFIDSSDQPELIIKQIPPKLLDELRQNRVTDD